QAEDGIRYRTVTGVQTCALPIYTVINYLRVAEVMADGRIIAVARNNKRLCFRPNDSGLRKARLAERLIYRPRFPRFGDNSSANQIGRASCRESVYVSERRGDVKR